MKLLLDTHIFLWWNNRAEAIADPLRRAIIDPDNQIFVSAASVWEISTKHRSGKLPGASSIAGDLAGAIESQRFVGMPITIQHAQAAGALPGPHRDPFDRMLIAQALLDDLVLVSNEQAFGAYGARLLW